MKENELPYYGVGPYYCGSIIIVTIASIVLSYLNIIPKYSISGLGFIFNMLGIAMIITAIALWIWGALKSDIHDNIDNDQFAAYSLLGLIDRAHEKNRREMAGGEIRRRIQKIL